MRSGTATEEFNGKRGSCEVGTCLYTYLTNLPENTKHVSLFSDSCTGQNRNQFTLAAIRQSVLDSELEIVDQKFLTSGHTQMEVDAIHSSIERLKKNVTIYTPRDWVNIIKLARRKKPYKVNELTYRNFIDFKNIAEELQMSLKIDEMGQQVKWNEICHLRIAKEEPQKVYYKYDFEEDFRSIRIIKSTRSRHLKQIDVGNHPLYEHTIEI
jgi:hypothetical protein